MTLNDIKTLQEVAREFNIPFTTLQSRLTNISNNLIENVDYKKLGARMPTLLSLEGIIKITKK